MPWATERICAKGVLCVQSVAMLRNITTFHTVATAAVERTAGGGGGDAGKITYNVIKTRLADLLYKITSQKFEDPVEGEAAIKCASPAPSLPCPALCMGCIQAATFNCSLPALAEATTPQ